MKWRPLKARPSSGYVQLPIKRVHSSTSSAGQKENKLHKLNLMVLKPSFFYTEKNKHGYGEKYPSKKQKNGKWEPELSAFVLLPPQKPQILKHY